ncbi:unnamed protein product [Blepharisma stoltei]|uniref:Uncharacterized protein n=1 Tax=Blepharisma stoltei TaxID=1481888 RepID=A0AAU9J682_9CILI|nr:unnamed protein product [Blepharisma stoltei]
MQKSKRKQLTQNPTIPKIFSNPDLMKTNSIFAHPLFTSSPASFRNTPDIEELMNSARKDTARFSQFLSLQIPSSTISSPNKPQQNKTINLYKSYPSPSRNATPSTMSQYPNDQSKLKKINKENRSLRSLINKLQAEVLAVSQENMKLMKVEHKCNAIETEIEKLTKENEEIKKKLSGKHRKANIKRLENAMDGFKMKISKALKYRN